MKFASLFTTLLLLAVDVRPVSAASLDAAGTPEEQERLKLAKISLLETGKIQDRKLLVPQRERISSIWPRFINLEPPQVGGAAPVDSSPLEAVDLARIDAMYKKLKEL
jgi:hypothetical protein